MNITVIRWSLVIALVFPVISSAETLQQRIDRAVAYANTPEGKARSEALYKQKLEEDLINKAMSGDLPWSRFYKLKYKRTLQAEAPNKGALLKIYNEGIRLSELLDRGVISQSDFSYQNRDLVAEIYTLSSPGGNVQMQQNAQGFSYQPNVQPKIVEQREVRAYPDTRPNPSLYGFSCDGMGNEVSCRPNGPSAWDIMNQQNGGIPGERPGERANRESYEASGGATRELINLFR